MASFKTFKKIRRKRARRRHDQEGVNPTTTPTKQNSESNQADILNLQETIGNQAVMQMMQQGDIDQPKAKSTTFNPNSFKIQQMPTVDEAQSVIEQPKDESAPSQAASLKIQRMPTRDDVFAAVDYPSIKDKISHEIFMAVVNKLQELHNYKQHALGDTREDIQAQFMLIKFSHDDIETEATAHIDRNSPKKFKKSKLKTQIAYLKGLIQQSQQEKAALVPIMLKLSSNSELLLGQPPIQEAIDQASDEMGVQQFRLEDKTGETKGGMNREERR